MRMMSQEALAGRVVNAQAAAQSPITSTVIDMQGFDAVEFVVALGTVTDGAVITATLYETATNSAAGGTATAGGSVTLTAAGSSNLLLILDVVRPKLRYLYLTITRTAQNAGVDSVTAQQYRARVIPVTQTAAASAISTPEV